ncbi:MAG: hypothetical protein D3922_16385, partial [Candidatus Electrothrix sp. AR1]|nr:hypothetical protein [Candidatus Electrothrix sp. AR1]
MSKEKSRPWKGTRKFLLLICLASFSAGVFLFYDYFSYKDRVYRESKEEFQAITVKTAQELDGLAQQVMESAESVAASLTDGSKSKKNINNALKKEFEKNPNFSGARIAFQPASYNPKVKLYSAGWQRILDKTADAVMPFDDDIIDVFSSCWYLNPMHEGKNAWSDPYWDKKHTSLLITYSALFYQQTSDGGKKEPVGVVAID